MADVVVEAENAGLDELWLGDEGPAHDPLVTLATAAARTTRIGLGVAVTNPYLRHPAATASAFATLAELAPGRVVLGLGAGGGLALGPVGLDRPQPLTRVAEAVRIARLSSAVRRPRGTRCRHTPSGHRTCGSSSGPR